MKYEVRKACNVFMYGNFVELIDIANTPHPADCPCIDCKPQPGKPSPPPYDELYLKQKADPWR